MIDWQVSDDVVTTVVPSVQRDDAADDDATTPVVFADEPPVTGESVTHRARQDGDDDDDDDATTVGPVSTTRAPVLPPLQNESTVLTEFNFVAQPVDVVAPVATRVTGEEEDTPAATSAPPAVQAAEDNDDSENEISQDEAGTTYKPSSTFAVEYKYTVDNFGSNNRV